MSSSFERLLSRAMRNDTDPGTPCPSAETLAAYLEGSLGRGEHASVELHASRCARCASHLATLVRLEDQLAAGSPAVRPWWRTPWLVPAAAAIVAGVVWTSLPRERVAELARPSIVEAPGMPEAGPARVPPAQAPVERPAPRDDAPSSSGTGARRDRPRELGKDRSVTAPMPAPTPGGAVSPRSAPELAEDALAPALPAPDSAQRGAWTLDSLRLGGAAQSEAVEQDKKESFEAPATSAAPSPHAKATAPPERPQALADAPAAAPPSDAGARGNVVSRDAAAAAAPRQERALRQPIQIGGSSPVFPSASDPKVAWRVTGGRVERTTDGGALWVVEPAPKLPPPVVGSAPSRDACWLAGNGLVVRRNADGTWTRARVDFAVTAVEARSALAATLTATDGRRFETTDGGRTWTEVR